MNSSLLASGLQRGARTHIDSLAGPPQTPLTKTTRRPAAAPEFFGQHQPVYGVPLSDLQRPFAAAQGAQHARPELAPQQPEEARMQDGAGGYLVQQRPPICYRMQKLAIRPSDGKKSYVVLGSGFLEWGRRFERQVQVSQSACDF
ncbi:hypothetical protein PC128_g20647 [Phytophthora cactorum]|nr:hypothetical protein PC128_g20647 [Phytophthora cactorum]